MKILIVGAGIGGLTTALSLHKAGFEVHIYESSAEIKALGVGINVLPHAVRVLTNLDLLDNMLNIAVPTSELRYFNKFGQQIWQEPRGKFAGYLWPQLSIHRGGLMTILLDAVKAAIGGDHIHTGHHLKNCKNKGGKVIATFISKGSDEKIATVEGDVLIGADGIHSVVRKQFYPDEGIPKFSGIILRRGTAMAKPFLSGSTMIMAGSIGKKFIAYPLSTKADEQGNLLTNWIADLRVAPDSEISRDWNRRADKQQLLAEFESWEFDWLDVPEMIGGADEIYEYPMSDRDPLPQWSFERITLLGDAAHPMYPIGSNGASQAILDAEFLTASLVQNADVSKALKTYQDVRIPETSAITMQNRQIGPEQVMEMVEERAPEGFTNLYDVISKDELEEVAARYKKIAGFEKETLNAKAK
ncbi:MAG TPA: flavin-dependent oxidoreductase [Mucilaginibacter sp.]|jgi:2-polyprenyl-6-methoxyphenol hydroxylase-like FAD-dependent oxidoreductase